MYVCMHACMHACMDVSIGGTLDYGGNVSVGQGTEIGRSGDIRVPISTKLDEEPPEDSIEFL